MQLIHAAIDSPETLCEILEQTLQTYFTHTADTSARALAAATLQILDTTAFVDVRLVVDLTVFDCFRHVSKHMHRSLCMCSCYKDEDRQMQMTRNGGKQPNGYVIFINQPHNLTD